MERLSSDLLGSGASLARDRHDYYRRWIDGRRRHVDRLLWQRSRLQHDHRARCLWDLARSTRPRYADGPHFSAHVTRENDRSSSGDDSEGARMTNLTNG